MFGTENCIVSGTPVEVVKEDCPSHSSDTGSSAITTICASAVAVISAMVITPVAVLLQTARPLSTSPPYFVFPRPSHFKADARTDQCPLSECHGDGSIFAEIGSPRPWGYGP